MTRSPQLRVLAAVGLLGLPGCYKASFIVPNTVPGEQHDRWTSFLFWGLVGEEHVDVHEFCSGPVSMVRTGGNFGTSLVSALTLGIYSPRKVYVTCAAAATSAGPGTAPSVEITLDGKGNPVAVRSLETGRVVSGSPVPGERPGEWKVALREEGGR